VLTRRHRTRDLIVLSATAAVIACSDDPAQVAPAPTPGALAITCPAAVSAQSTNGNPVLVQYPAPTVVTGAPPASATCTPPSGAAFPVGSTVVTCTASDAIRRTDACAFAVTVRPPPVIAMTKFVAFGDSMTAGEIVSEGAVPGLRTLLVDVLRSYPTDLQNDLDAAYPLQAQSIVVSNLGLSGESATAGPLRLPTALQSGPYQALLLMEGANDLRSEDTVIMLRALDAMRSMVKTAKARGLAVFLATLPPQNPSGFRGNGALLLAPYNSGLRDIAASERVFLVDVNQAFGSATPDLIDFDGLHPTAKGYQLIAVTFFKSIQANVAGSLPTSRPGAQLPSSRRR
jgi:lysophospholipase L1-like esterase